MLLLPFKLSIQSPISQFSIHPPTFSAFLIHASLLYYLAKMRTTSKPTHLVARANRLSDTSDGTASPPLVSDENVLHNLQKHLAFLILPTPLPSQTVASSWGLFVTHRLKISTLEFVSKEKVRWCQCLVRQQFGEHFAIEFERGESESKCMLRLYVI